MLFENTICGQKIVHGLVLDETNSSFAGVTVLATDNSTKTMTDINGNFELVIQSDLVCIKAKFLGYLDTLVCNYSDSIVTIRLIPDLKLLNTVQMICVDYAYVDNLMVGFYSGVLHNPYGITCSNFTSYLFRIPVMTVAQFDYRTGFKNNSDIHFGFARYHGDNRKDFKLGFSYDYDKTMINESKLNLDYYSHKFNTTWNYKRSYLFLGYGYSKINDSFHNGLLTGLSIEIPVLHLGLLTRLNYWFDYTEYSIDLYKSIPKTKFNISAGFEQLDSYKEVNLKLRYEIDY